MEFITVDRRAAAGKIKIMNAVNNGPTSPGVRAVPTSFSAYKEAAFPYARNHDASFFGGYGGEHTVDVHRIFKDFGADENDPASYIFEPTDWYLKTTLAAGTKIFYRLGASIEHGYKYGTRPPRDFAKWARICEHIIRHYNEGWANGSELGIDYWEIWNEPDCRNADGSNPCWQGTDEEFIELYSVTARHLKACFPDLKIGGPAFTGPWATPFKNMFLDRVAGDRIPLDFYSYHWYESHLESLREAILTARSELDRRGLTDTETILNEWNYIKGWMGDDWRYSLETEKNLKGSSFIAAAMCTGQSLPLDMLMYYDARPCGMNGLFEEGTYRCLKGYYPYLIFRDMRALGSWIPTENGKNGVYSCAATDGENAVVMLTNYEDDASAGGKEIAVSFEGFGNDVSARMYLLNDTYDLKLMNEQRFSAGSFTVYADLDMYSTVMIKLNKKT
ncbi:MAG: hypothetical protein K6D94_02695 [Clostridiales bacterium]|nr:hypothetical protein [Clostridiales bacterium]